MRCWKPTIDDAVEQMQRDNITRAVALPLFPQFSFTTTGSCFNYFRRVLEQKGLSWKIEISYVDAWFEEPRYIEAMAGLIRDAMSRFSEKDPAWIQLLYSAHSIPARYVEEESDPYLVQTEKTVAKINESLGRLSPSTLAFQSKVGPVKWLGPPTDETLREMGRKGIRNVLAIPISFVSDHIETLQEIDILYRGLAAEAGIKEFHRAASLNLDPTFIDALADIAQRALDPRHVSA
jgi:ferrochelatase